MANYYFFLTLNLKNIKKCLQKQICVKNINAIIKSDEYTNDEVIKSNYELILKNRGNAK